MCIKDKIKNYIVKELNKYPYFSVSDSHIELTYQGNNNLTKVESIINSINNRFGERLINPLHQVERGHFTTSINEASNELENKYIQAKARNQTRFSKPGDYYNGDTALREQEYRDYLMNPNSINYTLKSINIFQSDKAKQVFKKGEKNKWSLDKILVELEIPKEQKQLILGLDKTNREDIITDLLANYSYTVEINTAKTSKQLGSHYVSDLSQDEFEDRTGWKVSNRITGEEIGVFSTEEEAWKAAHDSNNIVQENTQHHSNLTVPGGTNYTENEIATPLINPIIKGHAQFSTNNGIGWFRSDEQQTKTITATSYEEQDYYDDNPNYIRLLGTSKPSYKEKSKTRRILELQSDLFQKGRDKEYLTYNFQNTKENYKNENSPISIFDYSSQEEYERALEQFKKQGIKNTNKENQFLQLLNKNNNWVTFFIKSIIQDSAKKGYEKVLFPTGDTASKIEGHTTLEEFKKQKEDRIKELEEWNKELENTDENEEFEEGIFTKNKIRQNNNEINQLKQELERIEKEGFGALKPIYNFYETVVANILKKQGFNAKKVTDEYGNTWNEIEIKPEFEKEFLLNPKVTNNQNSENTEEKGGIYRNFIKFKKDNLRLLENKLKELELLKIKYQSDKNVYKEYLQTIGKITSIIEGNNELGITGLKQEIILLEKQPELYSLSVYIENDINLLKNLVKSLEPKDIILAKNIISYYEELFNFNNYGVPNAIFSEEDMYYTEGDLKGKSKLSYEFKKPFLDYLEIIKEEKDLLRVKQTELLELIVNEDINVKDIYNNKLTEKDILAFENGSKDISNLDLWFYDIAEGLSGNTQLLAKIIFNKVAVAQQEQLNNINENNELLDNILPELQHEIKRIYNNISYDIFYQKDKFNKKTGKLIDKFSDNFYTSYSKMNRNYSDLVDEANSIEDYDKKEQALNTAKKKKRAWLYQNMVMLNIKKVPEIIGENEDSLRYKESLINIIGEEKYKQIIKEQIEKINKYEVAEEQELEKLLEIHKVNSFDDLPLREKNSFELWKITNNPYKGVEDYYNYNGLIHNKKRRYNNLYNNVFIPRKHKAETYFEEDGTIGFNSTSELTGFYDENFNEIENNPIFFKAYKIFNKINNDISNNLPLEMQKKLDNNFLLSMKKSFYEVIFENKKINLDKLVPHIWKKFQEAIRTVKEEDLFIDETGKDFRVNPRNIKNNLGEINEIIKLKTIEINQDIVDLNLDININKDYNFDNLPKSLQDKLIDLSGFNTSKEFLAYNKSNNVNIKEIIKSYAADTIMQKETLDLPKLLRFYNTVSNVYASRVKIAPDIQVLNEFYKNIKDDNGNIRNKAVEQMRVFIESSVLLSNEKEETKANKEKKFTKEEEDKIKEIDKLLEKETNEENIKQLNIIKDNLGGYRSKEKIARGLVFPFIRFGGLAYNFGSAITNMSAGQIANFITAAGGQFFTEDSFYSAMNETIHQYLPFDTKTKKKVKHFVESNDFFKDTTNDSQKASYKTTLSWLKNLLPYEIIKRVEYHNQVPLGIAIAKDIQVRDINNNVSNIYDIMNENGDYLEEFLNGPDKDLIEQFKNFKGEEYAKFKLKIDKCIKYTHGNYDEMSTIKAKQHLEGEALMMYKTWMTSFVKTRWGKEYEDLQIGKKLKGRYRSINPTQGLMYGALIGGGASFGIVPITIGAALGLGLGNVFGLQVNSIKDSNFLEYFLKVLPKDLFKQNKALFLRVLGVPVNRIYGKTIISTNLHKENFEELSDVDFENYKSNLTEMSMVIIVLLSQFLLRSLFGDDDDKEEKPIYNIFANKLNQILNETLSGLNPISTYKNITDTSSGKFLGNLVKLFESFVDASRGDDTEIYGYNAGKSKVGVSTRRFLPGMLRDIFDNGTYKFGFGTLSEKQWQEAPFDRLLESELKTLERNSKEDRANKKQDLIQEYSDSEQTFFGEQFENLSKDKQEKILKKVLNKDKELKEYKKKIKALKK